MKKNKTDEKSPVTPKEHSKKGGRREFLERTGLTAGGVLMTTIATGAVAKGQGLSNQDRMLRPDVFRKLFDAALTDKAFQTDILTRGFKALDARGFDLHVPIEVQANLEKALSVKTLSAEAVAEPSCGVCGVCGLCGLCGEINLGSASAALWALFALA